MLIGLDPTIKKDPEKVKSVLMMDDGSKGQLYKWLEGLFDDCFDNINLYATNVLKCTMISKPTSSSAKLKELKKELFENCKRFLIEEISCYKPTHIITFGELTHQLFIEIISGSKPKKRMKEAFNGSFQNISILGENYKYSPCVHITTYRVAETYGEKVKAFKDRIKKEFEKSIFGKSRTCTLT